MFSDFYIYVHSWLNTFYLILTLKNLPTLQSYSEFLSPYGVNSHGAKQFRPYNWIVKP